MICREWLGLSDQEFEVHVVPLLGAEPAHEVCLEPLRVHTTALVPLGAVTEN